MPGDNLKFNAAMTYYGPNTLTAGINASKNIGGGNVSFYAGGVTDFERASNGLLFDLNGTTPKFYNGENFSLSSGARIRLNARGENSYVQFRAKVLNVNAPLADNVCAYATLLADAKNNLQTGAWNYKGSVFAGVEADFGKVKGFIEGQPAVQIGGENNGKWSFDINAGVKIPLNPTK